MIKPELYKKTVDILYQAYFNDTLEHGDCSACAVGNIVSANMRIGDIEFWFPSWSNLFCTTTGFDGKKEQSIDIMNLCDPNVKKEIKSTGYKWQDLAKIEYAFEMAGKGSSKDEHMFNGLVSVLEVLKQIHEVSEEDSLESIKPFKVHYQGKKDERSVATTA